MSTAPVAMSKGMLREVGNHQWLIPAYRENKNNRYCVQCGRLVIDGKVLWQGFGDSPCVDRTGD